MSESPRSSFLRRGIVFAVVAFAWAGPPTAAAHPLADGVPPRPPVLRFEPNVGQTDPQVRFLSGSRSGDVFLTPSEIVLSIRQAGKSEEGKSAVVRLHILDANPNPPIVGLDPLHGESNYFLGNDPKKWHTHVAAFARVKYADVYPGIDLVAYGNEGNLEYDFQVAPGADPKQIAMSVEGADRVGVDAAGDLVMRTAIGEVRQYAPRIYQQEGATRHEVAGGYAMCKDGRVAFRLGRYSADEPLMIDPQLVYSTYFGGTAETDIHAIAVDAADAVYVAGDTYAHDFPTKNPVQSTNRHSQSLSAIVTKLAPDGASLVYSTYLGGSDTFTIDVAVGIAVDSTGAAYVTGTTGSSDFPTKNPISGVAGGGTDVFVTKLSADGSSLVYSSLLGGAGFDEPRGIVLDGSNAAYVFGDTRSTDFPTVNPTQAASGGGGFGDGFWLVISSDGSKLLFSTYAGGNNEDDIRSLTVSPTSSDVYLSGVTQSSNFAGNDGSLRGFMAHARRAAGGSNAPQGTQESTVHYDEPVLVIPPQQNPSAGSEDPLLFVPGICRVFLTCGWIHNGAPNPVASAAETTDVEVYFSGGCIVPPGSSTCSGNASIVFADAETLAVKRVIQITDPIPPPSAGLLDSQGFLYIAGGGPIGSSFPLVDSVPGGIGGRDDAFVTVFAPTDGSIVFSTFLGGSGSDDANGVAFDGHGNLYIAGQTQSSDFPTKNALQPTAPAPNGASIGEGNSFIAKISNGAPQPAAREPVEPAKPRQDSTHALPPRPAD